MKQSKYILLLILIATFSSCTWIKQQLHQHRHGDVLVDINGQLLYRTDIDDLTRGITSPEDSARIADTYIAQWKAEATRYAKARRVIRDNKQIETLAENYRRALYVHAYEEWLVENEMPKNVHPDSIQAYYDTHTTDFILTDNLVQGMLLVVPKNAPRLERLRKLLSDVKLNPTKQKDNETEQLDAEVLEKIEKYAYQNASGYELFTDQWHTTQNIILRMPMEENNLGTQLRQKNIIEMSDSVNTYFLRVTDKRLIGEPMPLEYAQPEIEQIILNQRKIEFIKNIR